MRKILVGAISLYAVAIAPVHAIPASEFPRFDSSAVANSACAGTNEIAMTFSACLNGRRVPLIAIGAADGRWAALDLQTGRYVQISIQLNGFDFRTFILSLEATTDTRQPPREDETPSDSFALDKHATESDSFTVAGGAFGFVSYATYETFVPRAWATGEVPEPATLALFGAGLIGLALAIRRRKIKP